MADWTAIEVICEYPFLVCVLSGMRMKEQNGNLYITACAVLRKMQKENRILTFHSLVSQILSIGNNHLKPHERSLKNVLDSN